MKLIMWKMIENGLRIEPKHTIEAIYAIYTKLLYTSRGPIQRDERESNRRRIACVQIYPCMNSVLELVEEKAGPLPALRRIIEIQMK